MTTATKIPPSVEARYREKIEAELAAELETERREALAGLKQLQADWERDVPPLDAKISEADQRVSAARNALQKAEQALADAESTRRCTAGVVEHQQARLRFRLENDLRHPSIAAALLQIEEIAQETRDTPVEHDGSMQADTTLHPSRSATAAAAARYRQISARLQWLAHTARPALLELQFRDVKDVDQSIVELMADLPSID